ncbi:hypothetical protein A3L04_05310 [Thermococcus chitonophagus]|uniref:DUF3267 domain-containing protein n=1 Tax=Thermococcus chitonophagus TaxID=54262 RepID=A0A160VRG1_9EURY|nr:hypothetical protein [Thermococcus chitonophagus]ASJ16533.1 hypothetical protein A3L04_05310 [Thermococcus chitonophagus]CUX77563.1 hypothetical protein CHITON_0784 [Thermococcus chitonophagus]
MRFLEFTRIVVKALLRVFLGVGLIILAGAILLGKLKCLINSSLNLGIFVSIFLMVYLHEVGHYIPLRHRKIDVKREGIGIRISTTPPVPPSAIFLSALLPLLVAVGFSLIFKNWIFIVLWLAVGAMTLIDAVEVI